MKEIFKIALGLAVAASTFAATIDIGTGAGHGNWQVFIPGTGTVAASSLSGVQVNGSWAPAPVGSNWVSWGANEGTSCVFGQTPGNGCAHALLNAAGDVWSFSLTISAASLAAATSGTLNFVLGSDNRVSMFVGLNSTPQVWDGGSQTNGQGFNPLGCSGQSGPTSAGGTQATYNNCLGTVSFNASNLNPNGSLTLSAYSFNDPIPGCPACGDPTAFILEGTLVTSSTFAATPEPATFGLVALAGIAGFALRRKQRG